MYAWSFRQSACIEICFETRQPRYRVQDGSWPNHKNFIFKVTFIFSKNVLNTLHFYIIHDAILILCHEPSWTWYLGWRVSKQISMQALCLNNQAYNCLIHFSSCIMHHVSCIMYHASFNLKAWHIFMGHPISAMSTLSDYQGSSYLSSILSSQVDGQPSHILR